MIDMHNLENLATEIGKDIKDIKTRYATKEELHEATEIDYSQIVTHEELEEKHYLTEHQSLEGYAKKSELPIPYDDSIIKQRLTVLESRPDNNTPTYRIAKGDISGGGVGVNRTITPDAIMNPDGIKVGDIIEDYWSGTTRTNQGFWKVTAVSGTSISVQGIGERILPTNYNDSELKQRILTLESRPNSGSGGLDTEEIATYSNTVIYIPNGNIVYNKSLKKLSFPKCNVKVGKSNYWCDAQEVSINGTATVIAGGKGTGLIA